MHQIFMLQNCSKSWTACFIWDERLRFSPPQILCFHKHVLNLLQWTKIPTPSLSLHFVLSPHSSRPDDHDTDLSPHFPRASSLSSVNPTLQLPFHFLFVIYNSLISCPSLDLQEPPPWPPCPLFSPSLQWPGDTIDFEVRLGLINLGPSYFLYGIWKKKAELSDGRSTIGLI